MPYNQAYEIWKLKNHATSEKLSLFVLQETHEIATDYYVQTYCFYNNNRSMEVFFGEVPLKAAKTVPAPFSHENIFALAAPLIK